MIWALRVDSSRLKEIAQQSSTCLPNFLSLPGLLTVLSPLTFTYAFPLINLCTVNTSLASAFHRSQNNALGRSSKSLRFNFFILQVESRRRGARREERNRFIQYLYGLGKPHTLFHKIISSTLIWQVVVLFYKGES